MSPIALFTQRRYFTIAGSVGGLRPAIIAEFSGHVAFKIGWQCHIAAFINGLFRLSAEFGGDGFDSGCHFGINHFPFDPAGCSALMILSFSQR